MFVRQWHLDVPDGKQGEALAPSIVTGSQHWVVYRVLDERPG
jgi:hypothetical protein